MLLLLALACAHKSPESAGGASMPSAEQCPAYDFDPPTCPDEVGVRGDSLERPWEWGWAAAGNTLWFDRLACGDGSNPSVERVGNFGGAPVASSSPSSGAPSMGVDVLDGYRVRCVGQEDLLWYTNLYRCGAMCVPAPFKVLPAAAADEMSAAMRALDQGEEVDALRHGQSVIELAPDFELSWLAFGYVQMVANDPQGAMDSAAQACDRFPRSAWASPLGNIGCQAGIEACCPPAPAPAPEVLP